MQVSSVGRWRPLILPGRWSWCDLDLFISILSLNFLDMRYEHLRILFLRSCFPQGVVCFDMTSAVFLLALLCPSIPYDSHWFQYEEIA